MSVQVVPEDAPHLGGYVPGGDEATRYPMLWRWLVAELGVRSVVDVGCGDGAALVFFRDIGCAVLGVDGVAQDDPDILRHDYTLGRIDLSPSRLLKVISVDLVWCCEFVEHVEERFVPNFLETFQHGRLVLLTHAEPGQAGHHHINCRTADYWRGALAAVGYLEDEKLTTVTRALARANPSPWNHYARSGLAFARSGG